MDKKNIALIGFMGSGKSTIGRILAKELRLKFVDLDQLIEKTTEKPISEIFRVGGESLFRELESAALRKTLEERGQVISCGGGIVLREENRAALKQNAAVVYLKISPEEAYARVGESGYKRPLLAVEDPFAEIRRLLEERDPLYTLTSDIIIDTTDKTKAKVADEVLHKLRVKGLL
jgi:shikimate kinase